MSNKTLVIYKSKTGFTKRYAQWIKEDLNCDMVSYDKGVSLSFDSYDTVIFGGGFYAGKINGLNQFKKNLSKLEGKKIIVFATGAAPAEAPDTQNSLRKNFTDAEWSKIKAFYMQSGLCYEKMGTKDKMMMAGLRTILKMSKSSAEALKAIQKSFDVTKKDAIKALVEYCSK